MSAKVFTIQEEDEMPESDALSVFSPKGKAGVMERMRSKISNALSDKKPDFLKRFAKEFKLNKSKLKRLQDGTEPVDYHFFEKAQEVLDISINDILGQPSFTAKQKKYWSEELKRMPMALAGPARERAASTSVQRKSNKGTELIFYVRRRAIHEMAWDETNSL